MKQYIFIKTSNNTDYFDGAGPENSHRYLATVSMLMVYDHVTEYQAHLISPKPYDERKHTGTTCLSPSTLV